MKIRHIFSALAWGVIAGCHSGSPVTMAVGGHEYPVVNERGGAKTFALMALMLAGAGTDSPYHDHEEVR